jgi:hypothetical protein
VFELRGIVYKAQLRLADGNTGSIRGVTERVSKSFNGRLLLKHMVQTKLGSPGSSFS